MSEWVSLKKQRPDIKQAVLVASESWSTPRVLVYEEHPFPRLIDRLIGRHYWYPERMQWTALPPGWSKQ